MKLVVFEGLDGSGKTTIARKCAEKYKGTYLTSSSKSENRPLIDTSQPTSVITHYDYYRSLVYDLSRDILTNHLEDDIFLDRYWMSTFCYHSALNVNGPRVDDFNGLAIPDLIIFLDVSLDARIKRLSVRGMNIEDEQMVHFSSNIRNRYLDLLPRIGCRTVSIDTSELDFDQTFSVISSHVELVLGHNG